VGEIGADQLLATCLNKSHLYGVRETEFLRSVGTLTAVHAPLSEAQYKWLADLAAREPINFDDLNNRARAVLSSLLARWLPEGRVQGKEYVARNPQRADHTPGSFRINVNTGKWADFATEARGGDPISLAAYLFCGNDQIAAAIEVKRMLGA
jgi:hypothetical protein